MVNPKIPKPIAARRPTISAFEFTKPRLPSSSPLASARIVKRRSTNLDRSTSTSINHQRQRVQFGRIKSTNQKMPPPTGTETDTSFSIKIPKAGTLKFL